MNQDSSFKGYEIITHHPNHPFSSPPRSTAFTFPFHLPDSTLILNIDAVITNYDDSAHIVLTETGGLQTHCKVIMDPTPPSSQPIVAHLQGQLYQQYKFFAQRIAILIGTPTLYCSFSLKKSLNLGHFTGDEEDEEISDQQLDTFRVLLAHVEKHISID